MTQDEWGQPQNPGYVAPGYVAPGYVAPGYVAPGYVVSGEVVPDDESGVPQAGQASPMTQFQKVASRGDQPGQPASQDPDDAPAEEDQAVSSPDAGNGDDWEADEDALEEEPAEDTAAGPAWGAAASASAPVTDPGADPPAPAGQAEEPAGEVEEPAGEVEEPAGEVEEPAGEVQGPADEAGPDGLDATAASMTQPLASGAAPRPPAATVPTVPIPVTAGSAGDGERPAAAAEAQLRPGESGTALGLGLGESGYASLIADTADLRAQWHGIQYKFVDDPRASVTEAADAIARVATRLEAAIAERQRGLRGRWDTSGTVDTETLRETLRMYRAFLDQLIGPEPS